MKVANEAVMCLDRFTVGRMAKYCREPSPDVARDTAIFDKEHVFPDGTRMAIQVCSTPQPDLEPCWTQGVLFSPTGEELGCTEVGETFAGEYYVGDYLVEVVANFV